MEREQINERGDKKKGLMNLKSNLAWYGTKAPNVDYIHNEDASGFVGRNQSAGAMAISDYVGVSGIAGAMQYTHTGNQGLGVIDGLVTNNDINNTIFIRDEKQKAYTTTVGSLPIQSKNENPQNGGTAKMKSQLGGGSKLPIGPDGTVHSFDKDRFGDHEDSPYGSKYGVQHGKAGLANTYTANSPIDDMYNKFKVREEVHDPWGYAKPPFILRGIQQDDKTDPQRWGTPGVFDIPRGGVVTAAERAALDAVRLGKFLIRPPGITFLVKQLGMQLTNPNTESPLGVPNPLGFTKIYDPVSSIANAVGGTLGLRTDRNFPPIVRSKGTEYEDIVDKSGRSTDEQRVKFNRLGLLRKELLEGGALGGTGAGKVLKFFSKIAAKVSGRSGETINTLTGLTGPGSLLGIGATTIRRHVTTFDVTDQDAMAAKLKESHSENGPVPHWDYTTVKKYSNERIHPFLGKSFKAALEKPGPNTNQPPYMDYFPIYGPQEEGPNPGIYEYGGVYQRLNSLAIGTQAGTGKFWSTLKYSDPENGGISEHAKARQDRRLTDLDFRRGNLQEGYFADTADDRVSSNVQMIQTFNIPETTHIDPLRRGIAFDGGGFSTNEQGDVVIPGTNYKTLPYADIPDRQGSRATLDFRYGAVGYGTEKGKTLLEVLEKSGSAYARPKDVTAEDTYTHAVKTDNEGVTTYAPGDGGTIQSFIDKQYGERETPHEAPDETKQYYKAKNASDLDARADGDGPQGKASLMQRQQAEGFKPLGGILKRGSNIAQSGQNDQQQTDKAKGDVGYYKTLAYPDLKRADEGSQIHKSFEAGGIYTAEETLEGKYKYASYPLARTEITEQKDVVQSTPNLVDNNDDLIKFKFTPLRTTDSMDKVEPIIFRAYLNTLGDSFMPSWEENQDQGRADAKIMLSGWSRNVSLDFMVVIHSKAELRNVWTKLDELAKLTYPIYPSGGSGFTGTYVNVTIGDLYVNEPMYVTDLSYDWDNETPWELEEGEQVPLYTTVSMQLGYIGRQRPSYEGAAFTLNTAGADMSTDEDAYYLGG